MRRVRSRTALLAVLALVLAWPPGVHADPAPRRELTTREACWTLGLRFAGTGMHGVLGSRVAREDMLASYERLKRVTGMNLKDFPRLTGDMARDGPRLGRFLRSARPKLARILAEKYDASHGALFRLGLDAQLLAAGYEPGHPLSTATLADMRAALPVARLPAELLGPVARLVETRRPRLEAPEVLAQFSDEVGHRLRQEEGRPAAGALHTSAPPDALDVWRLSALAAQALLLHVHGQSRFGFDEAFGELATRMGVGVPTFPTRDPADLQKTVREAYDHLTTAWAPPIVYRWEFRHAGTSRALFAIPLQAIGLRMDYAPGAAWVKPKSEFLKRHARYAGLPARLMLPLTTLLDTGAPRSKVHRAIGDLFVNVETYYKEQQATPAPAR